jgi:hyperosmotically inducible protein
MKAWHALSCAIVILAISATATAQDARDVRLAREIAAAVNGYVQFTIFDDVGGRVENGDVVLHGKVTMPYKKTDIEKRVARIDGVRGVRNEIGVLPVSRSDEDLRYRVARAIYGNPSFWNYAARANPPIHIVVEHGRVTLTGVVNSNVERMLACSLATGRGELSVTNALRTDAEVRNTDLVQRSPQGRDWRSGASRRLPATAYDTVSKASATGF